MSESFPQRSREIILAMSAVVVLSILYVMETGKGDIPVFECIEHDGKPIFVAVYCFDHWVEKVLSPANDN